MTFRSRAMLVPLTAVFAACGQVEPSNQAVEANAPASEVTATDAGATNANDKAQPSENETSSGMPVPGTNTPEHFVVNEDSGHNSQ